MKADRSRSQPHRARRSPGDPAALNPDGAPARRPGTVIPAMTVAFYGRTAHPAGTGDSRADRDRQLAVCRAIIAAYGGQVTCEYFDEDCRADRPWHRRPQGQALLAALSAPARPATALVTAGPWHLLPRRPAADRIAILRLLAVRQILLVLADTGTCARTVSEYGLLGSILFNDPPAGGHRLRGGGAARQVERRGPG